MAGVAEMQCTVFKGRIADHFFVVRIILRIQPRLLIALLGEEVHSSFHVARREVVNPGALNHVHVLFPESGYALPATQFVHSVDESAGISSREVGPERPGRINVSEGLDQIRDVGVHHALV